jgi:hypothetical protein
MHTTGRTEDHSAAELSPEPWPSYGHPTSRRPRTSCPAPPPGAFAAGWIPTYHSRFCRRAG